MVCDMYEYGYDCVDFMELYFELDNADFEDKWNEFSHNRYSDKLTDYGEDSDWDLYLKEEEERGTL
jgi:hypothetical protein